MNFVLLKNINMILYRCTNVAVDIFNNMRDFYIDIFDVFMFNYAWSVMIIASMVKKYI